MSSGSGPNTEQEPTWVTGRDILPPNLPRQEAPTSPSQPQFQHFTPAPVQRGPRRWSLLIGIPVIVLVVLVAGIAISGSLLGRGLHIGLPSTAAAPANASVPTGASADAVTETKLFNDPLVDEHIVTNIPAPKAPVSFIEAWTKQDSQTMWGELSPGAQQQFQQAGASATNFAQIPFGPSMQIKSITYVAGSRLNDGRVATIFAITFSVNGSDTELPYYFTVNTDGLIDEFH